MYKLRSSRQGRFFSMVMIISLILTLLGTAPASVPALAAPAQADSATVLQQELTPIYLDTSYSFEERAADLVSRMTLQEKASQMISSRAPAISRLGIREYGWWNEALHGVSRLQLNSSGNATVLNNTTSYPIALSLGSSWDPELMYREAVLMSDEAREVVPENIRNLDFWSPTINLSRDPRWGRNDESYSEDPYLTTKIVSQFVNGMEGKDMAGNLLPEGEGYLKTVTTLKHYAANNSEVNRLNGDSVMDDRSLREYYTAAFKGIVEEADVRSIMTSYNRVNGVPASASVYLMDNLMRQTFGFTGYITSDCDSVYEISAGHHWIPPGWSSPVDQTSRTAFALSAGEDLNCNAGYNDRQNYSNRIVPAVAANITTETGLFTENDVDTSLVRLFTARMQLGEFDVALGLDVPWATQAKARVPSWANNNNNLAVTETAERLAIAREVGAKSLVLLKNNELERKDGSAGKLLPIPVPASGEFKVLVIGALGNLTNFYLGGYSSTQGSYGQANNVTPYVGLRNAIQAINPSATVDFLRGFTGTSTSASGLTTVDAAHVASAANYDWVIVYVGTDRSTADEAADRPNINMPGAQVALINQVTGVNPNTVAVMETIGMVDISDFDGNVAALLWSSYNGQRKGEALADVLLGAYNPSGRLPFIWYQTESQIPAITDYTLRPTETNPGRTYMYFRGPLEYAFGHGLSYTTFGYGNLVIDRTAVSADDTFQVSVDVTNTGAVYGDEVVELYITTPDAPAELERPIKRLRGFEKVGLAPGETKTVTLSVAVPDLAFFDEAAGKYVVDNGRYGVQISSSSAEADILLQDYVQVSGSLTPVLEVVTVKPTQEGDAASDIPTRVIFQKGHTIVPQITVGMNDETLYGYIKKGGSVPFPAGMTFAYSSNRPEVVAVDPDGTIRVVGSGAATVTVTATFEGVSKSTQFVVRAKADVSLSEIKVDGTPISGFSPTVFSYDLTVPFSPDLPYIEATATDPDATVTIAQATVVPGPATITVTSGEEQAVYTVNLKYDTTLSGITVNGKPISAFAPNVLSYSMLVPDAVLTVPSVDATATEPAAIVTIEQATAVPGQATITVAVGSQQAVYTVSFQRPTVSVSDEFDSDTLGPQWFWVRERPETWSLTENPGSMTIQAEQGDTYTGTNTARNILLQDASGDWVIESKLVFSVRPNTSYQQGGLVVYQDDDNYIKLDWEAQGTNTRIQQVREVNRSVSGTAYVSANSLVPSTGPNANTVWFRIAKSGNNYTGYYSVDGITFTALTTHTATFNNIKVGLYSNNGSGTTSNLKVAFDYFHVGSIGEVVNMAPVLSATPVTQDVQYTDAIQPVTIAATDLAEDMPLSAATEWSVDGGAFQPGLPDWLALVPEACETAEPNATCSWTLQGIVPVPAGTYVVRTTVTDGWNYPGAIDVTITVTPEDALLAYTGESIKEVGKELALRATVWDSAALGYGGSNPEVAPDGTIGDISKMWIGFALSDCDSGALKETLYAQVADTGEAGDGIGTASSSYMSMTEEFICVTVSLVAGPESGANEWYVAEDTDAVLTIYEPSGQFVTAGGWVVDPSGSKGNFGMNGKYLKNGRVQGNLVYIFRGDYNGEPAEFKVKSNALNALAFGGAEFPVTTSLQGKATLTITRASDGVELFSEGNATFLATVMDSGTNGDAGDTFALVVYDKRGVEFKNVPETLLQGGNVVAHP